MLHTYRLVAVEPVVLLLVVFTAVILIKHLAAPVYNQKNWLVLLAPYVTTNPGAIVVVAVVMGVLLLSYLEGEMKLLPV